MQQNSEQLQPGLFEQARRHPADAFALTGIALICTWIVMHYFGRYAFDDSYVGYAYARNVALGNGYIFDHGPGTLLSTSAPLAVPLYALLSILSHRDVVDVAQCVSIFAMLLLAGCSYFIFRRYTLAVGAFAASAVLVLSPFVQVDWSHETLLAIAILSAGVLLLIRRQFFAAAAVLGIASLCRGETLIAVAAFVAYPSALLDIRKRLALCCTALVPYLAWSMFAVAHFGTPFSSTIASKSAQGRYENITLYVYGLYDYTKECFHAFGRERLLLVVLAGLVIAAAAAFLGRKPRFGEIALVSAAVLITALYLVLGLPFYFWFTTQFAMLAALMVAAPWTIENVLSSRSPAMRLTRGASALATCVLVFIGLRMAASEHKYHMPQIVVMPALHTNAYRQLGEWLETNTKPTDVISAVEFGKIHYYSHRNLIDPLGILAPGLSAQLRQGNAIWEIERYHPDVLVEADDFHYFVDPVEFEWFAKAYTLSAVKDLTSSPEEAPRTHFRIYRLADATAIPPVETIKPFIMNPLDVSPGNVRLQIAPVQVLRVEVRLQAMSPCRVDLIVKVQSGAPVVRRSIAVHAGTQRIGLNMPATAVVTEIKLSGGPVKLAPVADLRKGFTLIGMANPHYHDHNAFTLYERAALQP